MSTRYCPVCGVAVKLENLERHVKSVHPRQGESFALSEDERRDVRRLARPTGSRLPANRLVALILLITVLVIVVAFGLPRLQAPTHPAGMAFHWHPQLSITIDGQEVAVPANIGIDPTLWRDHSLDAFGMQPMPETGMGGMAPLHTHDSSGKIHLESTVVRDYTLGDFFRIWGYSFDAQQVLGHSKGAGHIVSMIVDGTIVSPSYAQVLRDGMHIEIVCGPG